MSSGCDDLIEALPTDLARIVLSYKLPPPFLSEFEDHVQAFVRHATMKMTSRTIWDLPYDSPYWISKFQSFYCTNRRFWLLKHIPHIIPSYLPRWTKEKKKMNLKLTQAQSLPEVERLRYMMIRNMYRMDKLEQRQAMHATPEACQEREQLFTELPFAEDL
jgi:hypothetical protein